MEAGPSYGLCVSDAGPRASSAKFTEDGRSIIVALDSPAVSVEGLCSDLFSSLIGPLASAIASWWCKAEGSEVRIRLGEEAVVNIGDSLELQSSARLVSPLDGIFFRSPVGGLTIEGPDRVSPPKISLSGPGEIGTDCSGDEMGLALDAKIVEASSRPVSIEWSVLSAPTSALGRVQDAAVLASNSEVRFRQYSRIGHGPSTRSAIALANNVITAIEQAKSNSEWPGDVTVATGLRQFAMAAKADVDPALVSALAEITPPPGIVLKYGTAGFRTKVSFHHGVTP